VSKSRQISAEGDDDGMWAWSGLELGLETSRVWVQVLAMISSQGKSSMWPTLLHALNGVRHLGPALIDNNIRLGFICPWGWNWWFIVVWSGLAWAQDTGYTGYTCSCQLPTSPCGNGLPFESINCDASPWNGETIVPTWQLKRAPHGVTHHRYWTLTICRAEFGFFCKWHIDSNRPMKSGNVYQQNVQPVLIMQPAIQKLWNNQRHPAADDVPQKKQLEMQRR